MKKIFYKIRVFIGEVWRQNELLYVGVGAPYQAKHWHKTRTGFRQAWVIACVMANIKFGANKTNSLKWDKSKTPAK